MTKTGNDFKCQICSKICISPSKLKRHMDAHKFIKPYKCSLCNNRFTTSYYRNDHEEKCQDLKYSQISWTPKTKALVIYRYCQYQGDMERICRSDVAKIFPENHSYYLIYYRLDNLFKSTIINYRTTSF